MKNIAKTLISCAFLLVLFAGCEEEITLELDQQLEERVVVEGRILNKPQNHIIRLTKTLSYFANEKAPALIDTNAYVLEEESGIHYNLTVIDAEEGLYQTPVFTGKIGETYSLMFDYNGESYKASAYLDTVCTMDSINYEYVYDSYFKYGYYRLKMSAFEPEPLGNVYMFYFYLNDTLVNDVVTEAMYFDDIFYNGQYLAELDLYAIPQEEITLDTNRLTISILSIPKGEMDFINEFIIEYYANNSIFNGPPANISSNLKNLSGGLDGLGYFSASAITTLEMYLYKKHDDSTNDPDYKH